MLTHPVQVAYGVADVRTAAARWNARGVGPFFVREHIPVINSRVFGKDAPFDHSSAYSWWGDVMVELIHQHDPGAQPVVAPRGVNHVAFIVDDFAAATERLETMGFGEAMYAEAGTDHSAMPFAFHDARHEHGHFIEVYAANDRLRGFYDMVRDASASWDGSDPLRFL